MTYDYELTLIGETSKENSIGDPITQETETTILCGVKSAGRSEFYQAAASGLKAEKVFVIHAYEYNGQKTVKFEGKWYDVTRTYEVDFEEMELVCSALVNGVASDANA